MKTNDKPNPLWTWIRTHKTQILVGMTIPSALAFGGLTFWTTRLPEVCGKSFVLWHEIVRVSALLSGMVLLIGLMSLALPLLLNVLEGRSFVSFVAARHVRASKSGFLTVISVLSILGVATSSCSLVFVSSVMGGFGADLKRKMLANNGHITIDAPQREGIENWQEALDRIRLVEGVQGATPLIAGEAMSSSTTHNAGAMVRGIDPNSVGSVIELLDNIKTGKFEYLTHPEKLTNLSPEEVIGTGPGCFSIAKGEDLDTFLSPPLKPFASSSASPLLAPPPAGSTAPVPTNDKFVDPDVKAVLRERTVYPGVIVGRELAKSLQVYVGDEVTLISPMGDLGPMGVMPRVRKFRVAAVFDSGMYEYDASHAYVLLDVAQELFSLEGKITSVDVKTVDGNRTAQFMPSLKKATELQDLRVRDWKELNKRLFSALALERVATFIILTLAIIVASFCIICTLLLMVSEKGKEIAVMKSLGAASSHIMQIFMLEGVVIGGIGTAFGIVVGVVLCLGLSWFGIRLDPEVYYINKLPVAISWADYLMVAISALAICTLATIYPAAAGSRLRPVEALRHE